MEGKWEELWKLTKEADAKERESEKEEADICDIVSTLVASGCLSKALKKATDFKIPRLEPDIVRRHRLRPIARSRVNHEVGEHDSPMLGEAGEIAPCGDGGFDFDVEVVPKGVVLSRGPKWDA
eukprot:scaffold2606_cov120-Isochrysis_galbana.AAC.8